MKKWKKKTKEEMKEEMKEKNLNVFVKAIDC